MRDETSSDNTLIKEYLGGDLVAFETLALRYQKRVFGICFQMLGSSTEAEDVTQETFIALMTTVKSFNKRSSFSTWIYRVTTNRCLDRLRAKKSVPVDPSELGPQGVMWQSSDGGPEDSAIARDTGELIAKTLNEIPGEFRAAVVLRDIEGLEYVAIAEALDTTMGTVKSRISRGRRLIAEALRQSQQIPEQGTK